MLSPEEIEAIRREQAAQHQAMKETIQRAAEVNALAESANELPAEYIALIDELTGHAFTGASDWLRQNKNAWRRYVRNAFPASNGKPTEAEIGHVRALMTADLLFEIKPLMCQLVVDCAPDLRIDRAELLTRAAETGSAVASRIFGNVPLN
jgi:hypothetical protein